MIAEPFWQQISKMHSWLQMYTEPTLLILIFRYDKLFYFSQEYNDLLIFKISTEFLKKYSILRSKADGQKYRLSLYLSATFYSYNDF